MHATVAPKVLYQAEELQLRPWEMVSYCNVCASMACGQDLANQIRHWDGYTSAVKAEGRAFGEFLNPSAAEWFSGKLGSLESGFELLVDWVFLLCTAW